MLNDTESQSDHDHRRGSSQPSPGHRADEDEYHIQQVSLTLVPVDRASRPASAAKGGIRAWLGRPLP
jgi:hypothetical protein